MQRANLRLQHDPLGLNRVTLLSSTHALSGVRRRGARLTFLFVRSLMAGLRFERAKEMFTATSQTLICLLTSRGIMCLKKAAIFLSTN